MSSPSELSFLEALKRREESAFEQLYDNYSKALFGVILRIVKCQHTAEDLLQDTFVKIWKHIGTYDEDKGRLFTWMLRIARHTAIDYKRSSFATHRSMFAAGPSAKTSLENNFDAVGLYKHVERLHVNHLSVVEMIYFQGYTQEEAAKTLNLPLGTVKTRIRKAVNLLRRRCAVLASHSTE